MLDPSLLLESLGRRIAFAIRLDYMGVYIVLDGWMMYVVAYGTRNLYSIRLL